jgi:RNA polymerase sigma-70 factor (ECF subfamily)
MDRDVELRLVAGLRQGQPRAFGPVYEEYRTRLFSFLLRMVGRRDVAEDLAQEVWMRLAGKAAYLRGDTRLEPWLFTVAHNRCVSYWRTRGSDLASCALESPPVDLADNGPSPEQSAESAERRARLELALCRLPLRYREVLLLVGVEGMTPTDAAAVCGLKPEAMRKRLARARAMLAERIDRPRTRGGRR